MRTALQNHYSRLRQQHQRSQPMKKLSIVDKMDLETIATAKSYLVETDRVDSEAVFYVLGGTQELLRQLIRVAERRMETR